ncbi:hypothetical protein ACFFRR_003733 [Megaselia abdita]
MKSLLGVVLCVSIGLSVGLPARNLNDDAEIVIVPKGQQGVAAKTEDSDEAFFKNTGFPFTPTSSFGFNIGFSDSFSDIFRRFHSRFNPFGATDSKEEGDDALAFPAFGLPIPEGGNTTHTVQVVDGHKVEINNTVYEKKGDFGSSVFKVRIINVRPLESGEEADVGTRASGTTIAPPTKKPESTRESTEDEDEESNDINSKYQPESTTITPIAQPNESTEITPMVDENIATTTTTTADDQGEESATPLTSSFAFSNNDDADSNNEGDNEKLSIEAPESSESINNNYGKSESEFEFEYENGNVNAKRYDEAIAHRKLEKLEYINKPEHPLQDEFSADTDSDSEEQSEHNDNSNININTDYKNNYNSEWNSIETQRVADNNIYANDIDLYAPESVPVDLSNDIAVNDMLADQGFVDTDAEVFDVDNFAKLHIYEPIKRK